MRAKVADVRLVYADADALPAVLSLLYDALIRMSLKEEERFYIRPEMEQMELLSRLRNEMLRGRMPSLARDEAASFRLSFGQARGGLRAAAEVCLRLREASAQGGAECVHLLAQGADDVVLARSMARDLREKGHRCIALIHRTAEGPRPGELGAALALEEMARSFPEARKALDAGKGEAFLSTIEVDGASPKVSFDQRGAGSLLYSFGEYERMVRRLL
jgi:hypothetical protein